MIEKTPAEYEDYVFPVWADVIGWLIGFSTIIPMPIGLLWIVFRSKIVIYIFKMIYNYN